MQTYLVENSSTINKLFYNEQIKELTVEFKSGQQYKYENVAPIEFANFCNAESKGTFLNEQIKTKTYQKIQLLND